jgi:hypothetical protein
MAPKRAPWAGFRCDRIEQNAPVRVGCGGDSRRHFPQIGKIKTTLSMKRIVFSFVIGAALLAGMARAAPPEPITHDATEKKTSVTMRVTGTLKIVLPAMPEAGHHWEIISNDPRILRPQAEVKPVAGAKGADHTVPWEVTFVAQRPGRSILRFVYVTADKNDVATPDEMREITVRVQ